MTCTIIVPVLDRPQRVKPFMDSVRAGTHWGNAWEHVDVLFIVDESDKAEREAIYGQGVALPVPDGTNYAAKINAGVAATDTPWVLQAADDLNFHGYWLDYAMWLHKQTDALVLGTVDLCNDRTMRGIHSTHTLVHRSYIEDPGGVIDGEPGQLMYEGYRHEYSDDEMVQTAQHRGVYAHAFGSIVEHLHPMCGKSRDDATYIRGRSRTADSRLLFSQRAHLWGGDRSRRERRRR